ESERAQPLQRTFSHAGGGGGQISRWRLPGGPPWHVRALRGHQCADPARGAEILERRAPGGLLDPRGRAAAALSRTSQAGLTRQAARIIFPKACASATSRVTGSVRVCAASEARSVFPVSRTWSFSVVSSCR